MATRERLVPIRLDEESWKLLNSYTEHMYQLLGGHKERKMSRMRDRRAVHVINAILTKFLNDHAERIRHADKARKIRHYIRTIDNPAVRAQASAATRSAFPVRTLVGAAAEGADGAVQRAAER